MKNTLHFCLLTCFVIFLSEISLAQTNTFPATGAVGIGTLTPNASSLLDITSTTRGVLFPRMTKFQRDAIPSPAQGLLIYQTNSTPGFYYYDGGWSAITPKSANKTLSNLTASTALNVNLLPQSGAAKHLGSDNLPWGNLYLSGTALTSQLRAAYNSSQNDPQLLLYENEYDYARLTFQNTSGSSYWTIAAFNSTLNSTARLNFFNSTQGNVMTISGDGKVGIGISDPVYKLDVNGDINIQTPNALRMDGRAILEYDDLRGNINVGDGDLNVTYGEWNTSIGVAAGLISPDHGTFLGAGSWSNDWDIIGSTAVGYNSTVTANQQVRIGNSSITSIGGYAGWTTLPSDGRFKKNVQTNVPGLEFINKLNAVTYTLDVRGVNNFLRKDMPEIKTSDGKIMERPKDDEDGIDAKEKIVYSGFIAQDVEKAAKEIGYDFSGVDAPKNDGDVYGIRYAEFVVPLVKAVQELSKQNDDLKKEVEELKSSMTYGLIKSEIQDPKSEIILGQNIPNPFNNSTLIPFRIPKDCKDASIMITNTSTSEVISVIPISCNEDHVSIDAGVLASGTYSYTLYVDGKMADTKNMVITR